MKTIVFLDFDGPLYTEKTAFFPENLPNFVNSDVKLNISSEIGLHPSFNYWKMDHFSITLLNHLAKLGCVFVLSTSWTIYHDVETLKKLLLKNGFEGTFHCDSTINVEMSCHDEFNRSQIISEWLSKHPEVKSNYIILDDLHSAPEMGKKDLMAHYNLLHENIFLAQPENGFSISTFKNILSRVHQLNANHS